MIIDHDLNKKKRMEVEFKFWMNFFGKKYSDFKVTFNEETISDKPDFIFKKHNGKM